MRIAIIAPPFIPVPPVAYGGTELFVAHLAEGLQARGHDVIVYANGDSRVGCQVRWRYRRAEWPITDPLAAQLKNADHTAWAIHDASLDADRAAPQRRVAVPFTTFVDLPVVATLHHPHEPVLSSLYEKYPGIQYVAISAAQARREPMPQHARRPSRHRAGELSSRRAQGRLRAVSRPDGAVQRRASRDRSGAARRRPLEACRRDPAGLPRPTGTRGVEPLLDGRTIEYVGEADLEQKNELLSRARALLFPIEWQEPFGLVMIEAMACGTPVLAFAGGAVEEIVRDGVNGWICRDVAEMAERIVSPGIAAESVSGVRRPAFFVRSDGRSVSRGVRPRAGAARRRGPRDLVAHGVEGRDDGRRHPGPGSVLHPGHRLARRRAHRGAPARRHVRRVRSARRHRRVRHRANRASTTRARGTCRAFVCG